MTGNRSAEAENVNQFFSGFAETWDSLYGGRRSYPMRVFDHAFRRDIYQRYELTFEHLGPDLTGKSILDVGCGSGIYCFEAAKRWASRVVGIDVAEGMIRIAAERSRQLGCDPVCEFVTSGLPADRDVPALQRAYDHAIVMGVTDYVEDLDAFLRALRPLVTGSAVLSFSGQHWLRGPLRRYRYQLLGRCAVYTYNEASIRGACAAAGFTRVDLTRLNHSGICYIARAYA
jgi:2-polyprenyl-3-methyl-5-hydroxy-6-metoxy-1,4-benzoquinol methylase